MKRLSRLAIAGLLLVCLPHIVSAQDVKIGFVDPVRLLELSPQGEKALRLLEQEFGPRDKVLINLREKILDMERDLEKNRLVMQIADAQKKQREIDALKRKLKREQEEAREDYNLRRNEELGRLQRLVRETIVEIAKEDGFDLIVEQAVYVSGRINLTERVLERLQGD
jgi:outer membrane protein